MAVLRFSSRGISRVLNPNCFQVSLSKTPNPTGCFSQSQPTSLGTPASHPQSKLTLFLGRVVDGAHPLPSCTGRALSCGYQKSGMIIIDIACTGHPGTYMCILPIKYNFLINIAKNRRHLHLMFSHLQLHLVYINHRIHRTCRMNLPPIALPNYTVKPSGED
jgi:hypothetical protein